MEQVAENSRPQDSRLNKKRWPYLILGVTGVFIIILFIVTLHYTNSSRRVITDLQIYTWQIDKIDALLIHLLNAETGARGYLVTGDINYLQPYIEAIGSMGELLEDIDAQVPEEVMKVEEYQRLKKLIKAELLSLSDSIRARQHSQETPEGLLEESNRLMDAIRYTIDSLRTRLDSYSASYFIDSLNFINHSRWIHVALFSGAFILLFSQFIVIHRQVALRKRISDLLKAEKNLLESQVLLRTSELNDLASYLTRMSEAEKRTIAQELHDEMGAMLTAAKMDASWIKRDLERSGSEDHLRRLERLCNTLDSSIQLKRKITTDLKPPLLNELGLVESLRAMLEDLAVDNDYQVNINLPAEPVDIDGERALALFRIAQESLTNIRKYSQASIVNVSLQETGDDLVLEIRDNGIGFDDQQIRKGSHGLTGMRHRTQMFGGSITIQSKPGKGTYLRATIPTSG